MLEEQDEANEPEMRAMLARTAVEWSRGRVSLAASGYELADKEGIQHGYKIMVQWKGTVADSALYHELLHETNQFIRLPRIVGKRARDQFISDNLRHREAEWWMLEGLLLDDF